ncbi:MAG TPA: hypothetical protein VIY86_14225, partial [Pirellulaceae bacterium]
LYLALRRLAQSKGLGIGQVGPVLVVGQPSSAALLATAAASADDAARSMPDPLRGTLLRKEAWSWPRLATPRSLVGQLALAASLNVTNLDAIPHDLWDARSLPAMTWSQKATLLLFGFDLYFQIDAEKRELHIVNMPRSMSLRRVYQVPGDPSATARALSERFPQAFFQVRGQSLVVRSTWEDQVEVMKVLRPSTGRGTGKPPGPEPDLDRQRFTLTVQDEPLGPLLRVLARRLRAELSVDPSLEPAMRTRVSFSVTEVTATELLTAAVRPAGLKVHFEKAEIKVVAGDATED